MASILVVAFCSIGLCAGMAFLVDTIADNVLRLPETDNLLTADLLLSEPGHRG